MPNVAHDDVAGKRLVNLASAVFVAVVTNVPDVPAASTDRLRQRVLRL
jgi:hypothetical protein